MEQITFGLIWYVAFLFSTTCHEAAHAFVAMKLGDPTAYHGGQVTLSPVPHVLREPFGTVLVPIISFLGAGWMIGWASAPYDPYWAERYPKRSALMSLAGPCTNLLLMFSAAVAIRVGLETGYFRVPDDLYFAQVVVPCKVGFLSGVCTLLSIMFTLNLLLAVFNILPLPPLDGSGAIPLLLPDEQATRYVSFLHQNTFQFLSLFIAWRAMDYIFAPIFSGALDLLCL